MEVMLMSEADAALESDHADSSLRSRIADLSYIKRVLAVLAAIFALLGVLGLLFPTSVAGDLSRIVFRWSVFVQALRISTPIALAAIGGIFAEKSGVINIGLEGLLIISAFAAVYLTAVLGPDTTIAFIPAIWIGFAGGVLASVVLAWVFAVVCIEFKADQIIAGLAVWLIALGLAPFASTLYFGSRDSGSLGVTIGNWPIVIMIASVALAWVLLYRTSFGRYIRAAGENPRALDTAGVNVSRVRYAGVLLSGVFAGMGGASLSLTIGLFGGTGETMVEGRGFIAIVAYLFGNYNPLGAFGASLLFGGLEAIQIRLQQLGYAIPDTLVQTIPYIVVILVLAFVGRTRIPKAAGEHYETEE